MLVCTGLVLETSYVAVAGLKIPKNLVDEHAGHDISETPKNMDTSTKTAHFTVRYRH